MTSAMTMTPQKTALITGITGQDGSYLAEFLLEAIRIPTRACAYLQELNLS